MLFKDNVEFKLGNGESILINPEKCREVIDLLAALAAFGKVARHIPEEREMQDKEIPDIWVQIEQIMAEIPWDEIKTEKGLLKHLGRVIGEQPGGFIGIIPASTKGPCPRVLLVVCGTRTASNRVLEAIHIAQQCRKRLEGIMFLPISWDIEMDEHLRIGARQLLSLDVQSVVVKLGRNKPIPL
jgi:hypothetical protein